jgi:hypothetical protein
MFIMQQDVHLQRRPLHDSLLYPHGLWCPSHGTCCQLRGDTSWWRGARHGNGNRSCRRSCWIRSHLLVPGLGWRSEWTANGKCQHATILMYDNKVAYSYLEDSTSCAFHLRTTRRPCGTVGRVSVNSMDGPGELPLLASVSASLSTNGLPPSVDSLPGKVSATQALFASAAALGRRWSGRGMSGCGG